MAAMASDSPPRAGPAGSSSGAGFVSRIRWFILAASVAAASSAGAFLQPVRPDPYTSSSPLSLDWWLYPVERNAFKRLPAVTGSLNGVHALRNSEHVWVVGDGGLLLHSADGGQSWRQDTIIVPAAGAQPATEDSLVRAKQQEGEDPKKNPSRERATQKAPEVPPVKQAPADIGPPVQQAPADTTRYDSVPTPRRPAEKGGLRITYLPDRLLAMFAQGQNQAPSQSVQVPASPRAAGSRLLLDLEDVHFLTPLSGWVVGARGTIAGTSDGGSAWSVRYQSPGDRLIGVAFADLLFGGTVTKDGTVIGTDDAGVTWEEGLSDVGLVKGLELVDSVGFVITHDGTLLSGAIDDDPAPMKPGASVPLNRLSFIDSLQGWATDTSARLWSTRNGGRTWSPVDTADSDRFASIAFASATVGWAVTPAGTLLRTDDGGRTWRWYLGRNRLHSVAFRNERDGWAVGDKGLLLHSSDGGRSWTPSRLAGEPNLAFVRFVSPDSGFIGDTAGGAWRFQNVAGTATTWVPDTLEEPLREVAQNFSRLEASVFQSPFRMDSLNVFRASSDGSVMQSRNDGRSWSLAEGATRARVRSMSFRDSVGWAVSAGGTVLKSVDRGASWIDPAAYKRAPAPWYWPSFLLVGLLLIPVMRPPRPPPPTESVADLLVSDRPIRRGDPDALGLSSVALGLSRFIRNSKTEPPLTLAITGQWGTGKSSLMNLLQDDLRQYGFRPIWFNAWHHQKEEHLLASLLHRVQTQAVPPLFHRNGIGFRARLLWYRAARFRWTAALLIVVGVGSAGYLASDWREQPKRVLDAASAMVGGIAGALKGDAEPATSSSKTATAGAAQKGDTSSAALAKADTVSSHPDAAPEEKKSLVAFLLLLLSGGATVWKGLRAFGGVPAALMTTVRGAFKLKDLKAQTGFRSQFETEFGEVTSALGAAQMVILIDDLDRCKPENVLEVLEAINFLVSSGACFVVLAMDRDFVEGCVGIGFKHVAEELAEFKPEPKPAADDKSPAAADAKSPSPADSAARGRQIRRDFAAQYLEKLINIEVPVPPASATQLGKIIARPAEIGALLERQRVRRRRMSLAGRGALVTLGAAALVSLFLWSRHKGNLDLAATRQAVESPVPPSARPAEAAPPPDRVTSPSRESEISPPGDLVPAEQTPLSTSLLVISLLLLAAAGLVAILRQPAVTVHDKKEFTEALNVWSPFLYSKRKTPRAIKRFVNRVRLYAMRQQAHLPAETLWDRVCGWVSRWPSLSGAVRWVRTDDIAEKVRLAEQEGDGESPKATAPDKKAIPEEVLVALSSIRECRAEWLQKPELYADFPAFLQAVDKLEPLPESVQRELADFRRWGPLTPYREKFLRLSDSVRAG